MQKLKDISILKYKFMDRKFDLLKRLDPLITEFTTYSIDIH